MRTLIHDNGFTLWLSANDTYDWAHRVNDSWPCSTLSNHRLTASFDSNGLYDLTIDGKCLSGEGYCEVDAHELSAIVADLMKKKLPTTHPCYDVAVGQFQ